MEERINIGVGPSVQIDDVIFAKIMPFFVEKNVRSFYAKKAFFNFYNKKIGAHLILCVLEDLTNL